MNRICGKCKGYIGNYIIAGDVDVIICNCTPSEKPEKECMPPIHKKGCKHIFDGIEIPVVHSPQEQPNKGGECGAENCWKDSEALYNHILRTPKYKGGHCTISLIFNLSED